jgi:RNA polymerase sigma factor (sigma-70 family)
LYGMHETDTQLLRRYCQGEEPDAEAAFAELVQRRIDLVWAAARRVTGEPDLARDVAQTVFSDLARKAGSLPAGTVIEGWLYRAAVLAAGKLVRSNLRRARWERQAMEHYILTSNNGGGTVSAALERHLDAALGELNEADRNAVVLRFLAKQSYSEIGAALNISDDTAQKRVSRALDKLRASLSQRGMEVTEGLVAAGLAAVSLEAAPAGMGAAVAGAAVASGGIFSTIPLFLIMKTKLAVGIAAGGAVLTGLLWHSQSLASLKAENTQLRQRLIERPTVAASAGSANVVDAEELARLQGQQAELLRLRGLVAELRRQAVAQAASVAPPVGMTENQRAQATLERAKHVDAVLGTLAAGASAYYCDNKKVYPSTMDQIRERLKEPGILADGKPMTEEDWASFELYPHDQPIGASGPKTFLFREKQPLQNPDGMWVRSYACTDGTLIGMASSDGDFAKLEQEQSAKFAEAQAQAQALLQVQN